MFQPAAAMAAAGIVMGPVHDATFGIPFVFPGKFYRVASFQVFDSRGQIDVVGNEEGSARRQAQDEPLMATAPGVVRKDVEHGS